MRNCPEKTADPATKKNLRRYHDESKNEGGKAPSNEEVLEFLEAVSEGDESLVKEFISRKIDPNCKDSRGTTAGEIAARKGHAEIMQLLIRAGVDVNSNTTHPWINQALECGHFTIAKALLRSGARVKLMTIAVINLCSRTASEGDLETMQLLIKAGIDITTSESIPWLKSALENQHLEVAECLLETQAYSNSAWLGVEWVEMSTLLNDMIIAENIAAVNVLGNYVLRGAIEHRDTVVAARILDLASTHVPEHGSTDHLTWNVYDKALLFAIKQKDINLAVSLICISATVSMERFPEKSYMLETYRLNSKNILMAHFVLEAVCSAKDMMYDGEVELVVDSTVEFGCLGIYVYRTFTKDMIKEGFTPGHRNPISDTLATLTRLRRYISAAFVRALVELGRYHENETPRISRAMFDELSD